MPGPPTHIHIDYWASGLTEVKFFLIDQGIGESSYDFVTEGAGRLAAPNALVSESWTGVDIPLSVFTTALTNVFQWKLDAQAGTVGDFYLDNIYLTDMPGVNLGTEDFDNSQFAVYPNPSNNVWNIKSKNQTINAIQVFDVLGKQVMNVKPNDSDVELDASTLPKGLYFAKLTTEFGSNSIKLIKN